jgi:nitroreductase
MNMPVVLDLIKKNGVVRKYSKKKISKSKLFKIIEAGRWSLSIHGFQPWRFVVVTNKDVIDQICRILSKRCNKLSIGLRIFLRATIASIVSANVIIIVNKSDNFLKMASKFGGSYTKLAKLSEAEAIGASIQNIILVAKSLGIGCCWTVTPVLFEKEIKGILKEEKSLMAILSLGYPAAVGKRSHRKPLEESVRYIR